MATGTKLPFSMTARRRAVQSRVGHRPVNNWGSGDLPAPWAEGDIVRLPVGATVADGRLDAPDAEGFYVVCYATSIDEGDAWYFRVANRADDASDRLHVAVASRSNFDEDVDYMAPFELVDTADPEGLRVRAEMLAAGWPTPAQFTPDVRCPTCGQVCTGMALDRVERAHDATTSRP